MDTDIRTTHKKLCDLKRVQLQYDKKLANLEAILKKVNEAKSKLAKAKAALLDKQVRKAAVAHSQAWNMMFASEMRSRLPREIRDLIYEQIWTLRDTVQAYQLARLVRGQDECPGRPCTCLKDRLYPHIMNPAFVGSEIALEAVESFYRFLPAYMSELSDPIHIKSFLYSDALHLGFQPVTAVRSMSIICRTDYHTNYDPLGWEAAPIIDRDGIEASFKLLENLTVKKGFKLRILISQRVIRLRILHHFLDIIKPTLRTLRDEGVIMDLAFGYRLDKHSPEFPECKYSLNAALDEPVGVWKLKLLEYLNEARDIHFLCPIFFYESYCQGRSNNYQFEDDIKPRHREYLLEDEPNYNVNGYFETNYLPHPTASCTYSDTEDSEDEIEDEEDMWEDDEDYDSNDSLYGGFGPRSRPPADLMDALFGSLDRESDHDGD